MNLSLKAHYLDIEWLDFGRARNIKISPEPIEIERKSDGIFEAETQVFHDFHPWVGLRLSDELENIQPAFIGTDGIQTPMLRLDGVNGEHWWVQNDGWDSRKKRHLSELHRSIGQFSIVMGSCKLLINNVVESLTRVDINEYLQDFQQELIWLVMGFGGATASISGEGSANQDMVKALDAFTTAARRLLDNPARHVREVLVRNRSDRLKPNLATFRHYLRNPTAQIFIGRSTEETANIADNRYVRNMVQVCEKISSSIARSSELHAKSFFTWANAKILRSTEYKNMTHRVVDQEIFDRQLEDIEKSLKQVSSYSDSVPAPNEVVRYFDFKAGKLYGDSANTIFYNNEGAVDKGRNIEYSVVQLPDELMKSIQKTQRFCDYYSLCGVGVGKRKETSSRKGYREVVFSKIFSVTPQTQAIERKRAKRELLEKNNWLAPLTSQERAEARQESRTAKLQADFYQNRYQNIELTSRTLGKCKEELGLQDEKWEQLGVTPSSVIPMGVRFSQSPNYAACLAAFSKVTELSKIAGIGANELDAIERIGVLHASALYERWCLVKIIYVLLENYKFTPQANWKDCLIKAVTNRMQSFDLLFARNDIGLSAILEIQPIFPNGRQPDFRLRFFYLNLSEELNKNAIKSTGLVLDAKFRSKWRKGEMGNVLSSLIEEKEYDQNGDKVFILSPSPSLMLRPTSPLMWGRDCDYGQQADLTHKKGFIYLAPLSVINNSEINLQRLIALLLQETFDAPVDIENTQLCNSQSFCVCCGKLHTPQDVLKKYTKIGKDYWILTCAGCKMQTMRTHCFSCRHPLFKNGLNFTYHRTVADQITNVVCPKCGEFFDNDVHGKNFNVQ